ncbi:hypothetical protein B0H13DRAFT_1866942 [Mycena leptocephala]|nr:hypothetical protein B0H13DRAFT_1866942 [Mycena leptocephala]
MKLTFVSVLVTAQLATAQVFFEFQWHVYHNGGCDPSSPPSATFPPIPTAPQPGILSACIDVPQGLSWNRVQAIIDDSQIIGLNVFVYCNVNCGTPVLETIGEGCNSVVDGCELGSFAAFPIT